MKTVDEHFRKLLRQLHVENLISPRTDDKISELEQQCAHGKRLSQKLEEIFNTGLETVEKFRYLNSTVPEYSLGDKLFDASFVALRNHQLDINDLARLVEYAHARVKSHAPGDIYDRNFYQEDIQLVNLPERIAQLTNSIPGIAGNFIAYVNAVSPETPIDQFQALYTEFKEIVLDGILKAGKDYASLINVRGWGKTWDEIRGGTEVAKNPEALAWANTFEALEQKYPKRDLPALISLYQHEDN